MPLEINAQFNKFVQFAQQQSDGEAVARAAPAPAEEGPLAGRAVTAALDDKFSAFTRSVKNKDRNNETRAVFRQAVNDIFGGAENLPRDVKKAMQLCDYDNQGKPLTARSILAVQKAILEYKARVEVDRAIEHFTDLLMSSLFSAQRIRPVTLSPAKRQATARAIATFARNLPEKGLRLLANYTTIAVSRGYDPEAVAKDIHKNLGSVRDIRPGGGQLVELERQLLARAQEQLAAELARERKRQVESDGVSDAFDQVGSRNPVILDGKEFEDAPSAAEEFKAKVKPEHRHAIAGFFSRMGNSPLVAMSTRAAPYDEAVKGPGAEMFASFDMSGDSCFENWPVELAEPKRSIAVSEDGKSATLTVETSGHLKFGFKGSGAESSLPVGGIAWKQEFVFDLSGPEAVLTTARIGQELDV